MAILQSFILGDGHGGTIIDFAVQKETKRGNFQREVRAPLPAGPYLIYAQVEVRCGMRPLGFAVRNPDT